MTSPVKKKCKKDTGKRSDVKTLKQIVHSVKDDNKRLCSESFDVSSTLSPFKRLKITPPAIQEQEYIKDIPPKITNQKIIAKNVSVTSSTEKMDEKIKRKKKFVLSCQEVCFAEFSDVKTRLCLSSVPNCCINKALCKEKHGKDQPQPFKILSYEQEAFNINYKSGMWSEAIDICRSVLKNNKFPSANIMMDIARIILNYSVEDPESYLTLYTLQRCVHTLKLVMITHPPCTEVVRKFYKNFIIYPFTKKNILPIKKEISLKDGLFKYILSRLNYEMQSNTPDGPIIEKRDKVQEKSDILQDVESFDKLETHQTLPRADRINRLFMILEVIVDILEQDIAIWLTKNLKNPSNHMIRSSKPLIASILWNDNALCTGMVNDNCRQIFMLLVDVVKLKFPHENISLISRMVSLVSSIFYLCERNCSDQYPSIGRHCIVVADEIFKIIKNEDINSIIAVIEKLCPKYQQHLVSSMIIKDILKTKEENYLIMFKQIFNNRLWTQFGNLVKPPAHHKSIVDTNNMQHLSADIFRSILYNVMEYIQKPEIVPTEYNHQGLCNNVSIVDAYHFIVILYLSFTSFLEIYNVEKIQNLSNTLINSVYMPTNNKENTSSHALMEQDITADTTSFDSNNIVCYLYLNEECIRKYVSIFRILKEVSLLYSDVKNENPHIFEIFDDIQILQLG